MFINNTNGGTLSAMALCVQYILDYTMKLLRKISNI